MSTENGQLDRRGFLGDGARVVGALGLAGFGGVLAAKKAQADRYVWQIDPDKCVACRNCETHCVLDTSAVKAVQCFLMCGYCDRCTGYLTTSPTRPTDFIIEDSSAENQLCPTNAIQRKFIEKQADTRYFEYTIDEAKCIGCGMCVLGCRLMNGSLYLQVRHDRCVNCNECSIAVACPSQAFRRVPAADPYLLMKEARGLVGDGKRDKGAAQE